MPASLLMVPSITICNVFSMMVATSRVINATPINTMAKASMGSKRSPMFVLLPSHSATVADNFKAAASPIKNGEQRKNRDDKSFAIPFKNSEC